LALSLSTVVQFRRIRRRQPQASAAKVLNLIQAALTGNLCEIRRRGEGKVEDPLRLEPTRSKVMCNGPVVRLPRHSTADIVAQSSMSLIGDNRARFARATTGAQGPAFRKS
jgi:hypothetical protein